MRVFRPAFVVLGHHLVKISISGMFLESLKNAFYLCGFKIYQLLFFIMILVG